MTDFAGENLIGSRFEDVYLTDARFHDVDLTNARFHLVDMTGVMIRGAALVNMEISGEIENLQVNGVDVVPLVEAELNRRYPDRVKMRPTDADPRDRGARPSLNEVLALRADRMATVRQVIADLTDEKLATMTEPVMEPGYPEPESFAVSRCLRTILNEEWEHRLSRVGKLGE